MKNSLSIVRAALVVAISLCTAHAQQWIIDGQRVQSLEIHVSDPQALYTDGSREMTAPILFSHSLSQTSGIIRVCATDNEGPIDYFKELGVQDGLQFSSVHSASLFFGQSYNDGLLIGPSYIMQTGYGYGLNFETGNLGGWHVDQNPTDDTGIVNKGYADTRYLCKDTAINSPITFASSLTATSGMIRATIPWDGEHGFFIMNADEEVLKLSTSGNIGFQIGGLIMHQAGFYQIDEGTSIQFGEHMLSGGWQIDEVLPYPEAIISRGYADGRYLLRTTGITTNRVIQDGNTLVISNGLITAILP